MRARVSALLASVLLASVAHGESPDASPAALPAAAPVAAPGIRLQVETPASGAVVAGPMHMVELRGSALAGGRAERGVDIVIVLDVSQSTRSASGSDVDGDGHVGEDPHLGLYEPGEFPDDVYSTDPDDTILAAAVRAARVLLDSLDARHVRVGLVSFSGEVDPATGHQRSREQQDARLDVPLTDDFARVHAALDTLLARGPSGATNFAAGIRLATTELAGLGGAQSRPRAGAGRVMLFLSDGVPTFPIGAGTVSDTGDVEAAVAAARVAHAAGIRINTYALGPGALAGPIAATEVARVTLGSFTPVREPGRIVAVLQSVSFANVEDVGIVNLTTREDTPDVRLNPDGSFVGFVPVREGRNRVLVNAVAEGGASTNLEIEFDFRLAQAQGQELERDLARLRRINDELLRELEAERVRREKRRQRMQTEIEVRGETVHEPGTTSGTP